MYETPKKTFWKKFLLLLALGLFVALTAWIALGTIIPKLEQQQSQSNSSINEVPATTPTVTPKIDLSTLPGPLVQFLGQKDSDKSTILSSQIITDTNNARVAAGIAPLVENQELDASAHAKVADMFTQQYFEHENPQGHSADWFVSQAGYQYILIGENLALGDFDSSQAVVNAWLASPPHRANMLDQRFTDIGVAAEEGDYQGEMVWMIVQHFGLPQTVCPNSITPAEKTNIDNQEASLSILAGQIEQEQTQINSMSQLDPTYQSEVDDYNAKANDYNQQIQNLKQEVASYNAQVNEYNTCVANATNN